MEKVTDYDDKNTHLFTQRVALREEMRELQDSLKENPTSRRIKKQLNRVQREFDTLTHEIVLLNYGLVVQYVKKFSKSASHADAQDFESAGQVGLLRAIETFQPELGKFGSWAYKPIQREVLREVHKSEFATLRAVDFERRPAVLRAYNSLLASLGRPPTYEEVAEETDFSVSHVEAVLNPATVDSIHRQVGDSDSGEFGDLIEDSETDFVETLATTGFVEALGMHGIPCLNEREIHVLVRRFGLDAEPAENLSAIGETMNLSREAVRQIEAKAIAKVNHPVTLMKILANTR